MWGATASSAFPVDKRVVLMDGNEKDIDRHSADRVRDA